MLNYVWIGLLFLGIGAAVTTDLMDINENTYHNNEPITISVQENQNLIKANPETVKANLTINKNLFNKTYNDSITSDITFSSVLTFEKNSNEAKVVLLVNKNMPKVLQSIAKASGKDNDINATLYFKNDKVKIIFEKVSFLKLKNVTNAALQYAGIAVNIALGLIGIMALWIGIMKVA
ncbi:MAG TPA: nucleoside recognition protein, partial [Ignavibacteria bacterium]|nr:nucleoside recognition protein [Ignavibacteria bacterium]